MNQNDGAGFSFAKLKSLRLRWVLLLVFGVSVISIVARFHFIETRPLAGRLDGQEPESHILVTDTAFDQTSWRTHHFLPIFTLGAPYNKFVDDHPGAESADSLGNYYYCSTPPLTFALPYFALKLVGAAPSIAGLRWYNVSLQVAAAAALGCFVFLAAKKRGLDLDLCLLGSATAAVIYMTAPECLKSHSMNLWAQQFYAWLLFGQLICLLIYPRPLLLFVFAFVSCLADWTPYMANSAMAAVALHAYWRHRDPRALKSGVAILLGCLLGGLCMIAWFSTVMTVPDYFRNLAVRSSDRAGTWALMPFLLLNYVNSFGLFAIVGLLVLALRLWARREKLAPPPAAGFFPGRDPLVLAFIILAVALTENILMAGHASNYSYDRLKGVQLLALLIAWGAMSSRKLAGWILRLSVVAGLCSVAIFLKVYDTPGGWAYIRQAEQSRLGDIIIATASTNGPAFFNGDVRGAEVFYAQRNLVQIGSDAGVAAFAQRWCNQHHYPEGTMYEISGHYPFSDANDLPRSVAILRVHAQGGCEQIGSVQLSEQAGDYHVATFANHPFRNWRQHPMALLKVLLKAMILQ